MNSRIILLVTSLLLANVCYPIGKEMGVSKDQKESKQKIFVEKIEDRNTGCKITFEYYKGEGGKKIMHGKYKRQWSLPKSERSTWSGRETVTATFVNDKLNGQVIINCDKQKWKKKNEFIKGKGRKVMLIATESYIARNLVLDVKNDTLAGSFNFELGDLKYEALGKVNEQGELKGKYTLYQRNMTLQTDAPRNIKDDWVILEQFMCDPDYTYKDAIPQLTEIKLGYPGTSRGEHLHIKIPRLRLSINPL